jgi:hypothetical protein
LQLQHTLRDLFGITDSDATQYVTDLRADPATAGFMFDNDGVALSVDDALYGGYQRMAATLATRVVDDAALFARATGGATEAQAFVRAFGLRAHRRPLSDDELAEYTSLHAMGAALDTERPAFRAGARLVIEAMLQSPHFLYRIEESETAQAGVIALNDHEIAARLSYALWGSMPDAPLFDAAAAGTLRDGSAVAAQAARMLEHDNAAAMITHFHAQLFETEGYDNIAPSAGAFPDAPDDLGALAREENERFVRDVVLTRDGGYRELLTSTQTFVNADLARIYGLTGSYGEAFVPATLDPSERRGVFTQVGFLAANATSAEPDPIHRGVFLARRIVCLPLAAPPANIPPLPPTEGRTNRETIEAHTEAEGTVCKSCHQPIINPLGFPFEGYDALGAVRTEDNGHPIDAQSNAPVGSSSVAVDGALELADALAASVDVHGCYAKHWVEALHGRATTERDTASYEALGAASQRGELSVRELIVRLVTSPAFLSRSNEELP